MPSPLSNISYLSLGWVVVFLLGPIAQELGFGAVVLTRKGLIAV